MTKGQIQVFLKTLNIWNVDERDEWVNCSCPLAKWTHVGGHDNNPSFGVRVNSSGESIVKCWSCGHVSDLMHFLNVLRLHNKKKPSGIPYDWKKAYRMAEEDEESGESYDFKPVDYEKEEKGLVEFPSAWLNSFIKGHQSPYLLERGVPEEMG